MKQHLRMRDGFLLAFLGMLTILYAVKFVDFSIAPFEDAAILMRYAQHLGEGYGFVWNIGEKPVDGATDFLFTVLLGGLVRLGLPLEFATRLVGFSSHLATVGVVYLALRWIFETGEVPAFVSALVLAIGPGLYYVAAYFGTPFFALFASLTWLMVLVIVKHGVSQRRAMGFAFLALVTSLIRPEGVILTGLMLLTILCIRGGVESRLAVVWYIGVFVILGGTYFLWRWNYFGFPLPNPFYKKGGVSFSHLLASVENVLRLCLPYLPAFLLGFYSAQTFRLSLGFLIPIAGFTLSFAMISNEMNFGGRFQYVLLPLMLMIWWPLVETIPEEINLPTWGELDRHKRFVVLFSAFVLVAGVLGYQYRMGRATYHHDGRYDVALMLAQYEDRHLKLATTEAGILPLYSGWRSLDTWGLNDQWIAHHGGITEDYLDSFSPHIIIFHAYFSPIVPAEGKGPWFEMVMTLKKYAEEHDYVLAASFGDTPYNTHYYYVRPDFPESEMIIRSLRTMSYSWYSTGREAKNYALYVDCEP